MEVNTTEPKSRADSRNPGKIMNIILLTELLPGSATLPLLHKSDYDANFSWKESLNIFLGKPKEHSSCLAIYSMSHIYIYGIFSNTSYISL